jgi:hypothetical protein
MSGPRISGLLAVLAAVTVLTVLPATASAASVTLTSPADGAKFYTGNGAIADAAPLLASRDVSGCLANQDNAYWRVYSTDSQGRTLVVAQSTGPTINIQRLWLFSQGVYQIYGEFVCGHADGTTTPIRSDVHTISVLPGNPPGTTPPPTTPPPIPPAPDTTRPVASHVTISQPVLTIFGKPVLVFRWDSSEPTKAKITLARVTKGISVARCTKPRKGRHGKPCKLYKTVGSLSAPLGATSKSFNGKLHGHWLSEGSYRATVVLTDAAGNASKAKDIGFRVKRPKHRHHL